MRLDSGMTPPSETFISTGRAPLYFDRRDSELDESRRERLQRRAFVDALRADIWAGYAQNTQSSDLLAAWGAVLERSLSAVEVGIWECDLAAGVPQLIGRSGENLSAAHSASLNRAFEQEVRQVMSNRALLVVGDASEDVDPDRTRALVERGIQAVVLVPVLTLGDAAAVMAVFLGTLLDGLGVYAIESAGDEMSKAFERLQMERRLRESNRAYAGLLRSAPAGIVCLDRAGAVTQWNDTAETIFGWSEREVRGRTLPVIPHDQRDVYRMCFEGASQGQVTRNIETRAQAKSGNLVHVGLCVSPLKEVDGSISGLQVILTDIGERKRASQCAALQQAVSGILAKSQSHDDAVFALLAVVCSQLGWSRGESWTIEPGAKHLAMNLSWQSTSPNADATNDSPRRFRFAFGEGLPGRVWKAGKSLYFTDIASNSDDAHARLAVDAGCHDAFGFPIRVGENVAGVLLFLDYEIESPSAEICACLSTIADQVSDFLKRLETQTALNEARSDLKQSQKMDALGRLAGGIAHDFNNLLTIILGHTEIALDSPEQNPFLKDLLTPVADAAKRASGLTRQLLAFSRKQFAEPAVLNINLHIEDMRQMLCRLIGEEVRLAVSLCPQLGLVKVDPVHFEQVVLNLIVNAVDAMPSGGEIRIETNNLDVDARQRRKFPAAQLGSYILLSVSDTGCGMDEQTKARIFEPFFTTKPVGKGTGMGLSTVFGIVKECGGEISVESTLGAGTTFHVLIPRNADALEPWRVESKPESVPCGWETVLVVDDEAAVRTLVARLLKIQGYTVLEAENAKQALEMCSSHHRSIDLLVTDVVMPGISGPQLAERVMSLEPAARVLYVSGYSDRILERQGEDDLVGKCLRKPFTTLELLRAVRDALGTKDSE